MPLDVNISQVGEDVPPAGVTANWFRAGAVVTIEATDVDGTADAVLLWRPEQDTTATLTPAGPNTWTITPDPDIMPWGGSYRIRIEDDSDVVYRTFSIAYDRVLAADSSNTIDGLQIPSPMETGDNEASLGNLGANVVRRSESNARISVWPRGDDYLYETGSPWGWWRYLRDITRWLFQAPRYNDVGATEISLGRVGVRGNDYNATRANTVAFIAPAGITLADKGKAMFVDNNGRAVFGNDSDINNDGRYIGAVVDATPLDEEVVRLIYHGLAVVQIRDSQTGDPADLNPGDQFRVNRTSSTGYSTIGPGDDLGLACGVVLESVQAQAPGAHYVMLNWQPREGS